MKQIENTNYFIHTDGRISGIRTKFLQPKVTKTGYNEVCIRDTLGNKKSYRVHRLVAMAYIPNPENKPFVNHIDGNKLNNSLENLEWVTHQENMDHAKLHQLVHYGERNKKSIVTNSDVEYICKLLQFGYRNKEICDELLVSSAVVSSIRNASAWSHISCKYTIPRRSRALSHDTISWICHCLEGNLKVKEIITLSNNRLVTKDIIKDIKRRRIYKDISASYSF